MLGFETEKPKPKPKPKPTQTTSVIYGLGSTEIWNAKTNFLGPIRYGLVNNPTKTTGSSYSFVDNS